MLVCLFVNIGVVPHFKKKIVKNKNHNKMEIKKLEDYTERQLLELIISNQARMEQRLYKIYWFMSDKYGKDFQKHNEHIGEAFKEFIDSFSDLNQQIDQIISE